MYSMYVCILYMDVIIHVHSVSMDDYDCNYYIIKLSGVCERQTCESNSCGHVMCFFPRICTAQQIVLQVTKQCRRSFSCCCSRVVCVLFIWLIRGIFGKSSCANTSTGFDVHLHNNVRPVQSSIQSSIHNICLVGMCV